MGIITQVKSILNKSYNYCKQIAEGLFKIISGSEDKKNNFPPVKRSALFGAAVLVAFFLIFGLWSIFASLDSAAMTKGKVVLASNRKTIQHLEGGIIKQIFVHEGSVVKVGDPLIQLDETQIKSTVTLLQNQANNLLAEEARLKAERDHANTVTFPNELLMQKNDPEIQKLMSAQISLFDTNKKTIDGQLEILQHRIIELEKQIQSSKAQVDSSNKQLLIIEKELQALEILDKKRLIEKPRLWALQREAARIAGNRDELIGTISETQQKIGETKQQILTFQDSTQKDILQKLQEMQSKLSDILERKNAALDQLHHTTILAPYNGTVVGLKEHTIGGVILAGKPILDLVPSNEQLIVEAKVDPLDIDSVHTGLAAKIKLIAYNKRSMSWVNGTVTEVSADIFEDKQSVSPESYYLARITVPLSEFKQLQGVKFYPGMPVEVMIIIDHRSPWSYFFSPIKDSFFRAFHEQ